MRDHQKRRGIWGEQRKAMYTSDIGERKKGEHFHIAGGYIAPSANVYAKSSAFNRFSDQAGADRIGVMGLAG